MSLTGTGPDDPIGSACRSATCSPACTAPTASVAALHERDRTGRGTVVRTSLLAAIVGVHAFQGTRYTVAGEVPYGQGNHHPSICPYGLFHCADGLLQIAVGSEGLWRRLAAGLRPAGRRARLRDQRRAGAQPGRGRSPPSTRRSPTHAARRPAAAAGRARRPRRRGALPRPGLRLGADPVPGPARRGRARHGRPDHPARPAAALRRRRGRVEHTAPPTLGQHDESVRRWLDGGRRPPSAPGGQPRRPRADRGGPRRGQLGALGRAGRRRDRPTRRTPRRWPRARERTGLDEAVVTGEGRIRGRRVAVVACEFGFLAGSIGVQAAERLVARGRAGHRRAAAAAGVADVRRHPDAGGHGRLPADGEDHRGDRPAQGRRQPLPRLPAQPDDRRRARLVGLARARHRRRAGRADRLPRPAGLPALYGGEFPAGVQTAENLYEHGLVDAVVPPEEIAGGPRPGAQRAGRAARGLARRSRTPPDDAVADLPAWESIRRSRRPDRPGVRQLLRHAARDVVPLHGTGAGEIDAGPAPRAGPLRRGALRRARPGPAAAGAPAARSARPGCARRGAA